MPFSTKLLSTTKAFSCTIKTFSHVSPTLGDTTANFAVIIPPTLPALPLYWLSGLTCTPQNFLTKAGAAQYVSLHNVVLICPDTSPRGANIPGEDDAWDFGTGAGFYVDATQEPWSKHYRMASYIVDELPKVVKEALGNDVKDAVRSVFGHSMGGMGALSLALRNRGEFVSVSAFSPIANPVDCQWGAKCFSGYLGENKEEWEEYDPTCLMRKGGKLGVRILVEQGSSDQFLEDQLKVNRFVEACKEVGQEVELNMAKGYDHSYYFIQTFVGKHIAFHAAEMKKATNS